MDLLARVDHVVKGGSQARQLICQEHGANVERELDSLITGRNVATLVTIDSIE